MKNKYLLGILITGLFLNACENTIAVKESEPVPTAAESTTPITDAGSGSNGTTGSPGTGQPVPASAAASDFPSTPASSPAPAPSSSTSSTASTPTPPVVEDRTVPTELRDLLNSVCGTRPTTRQVTSTINGQQMTYTEVLSEAEEGSTITDATQLSVTNKAGRLYLEPSSDSRVVWAARKWVLAESQQSADGAMTNIAVQSRKQESQAQVIVEHPSNNVTTASYQVCLVVRAPAEWTSVLANGSGTIDVLAHRGSIDAVIESGNISIDQVGAGSVAALSGSGNVTVESDSSAAVDLRVRSGNVRYTLLYGGAPLQYAGTLSAESGSVYLTVDPRVGYRLDAATTIGSISVPTDYPSPSPDGPGEFLLSDIQGGGATLTARVSSGSISILDL